MTSRHETPYYVSAESLRLASQYIRDLKSRSYQAMELRANDIALDVGCGAGVDTVPMASVLAPSGRVIGIDNDPAMVAEANAAASRAGVSGLARHFCGDAYALPFATETFDACRVDRLLQHVAKPASVLAEMRRVTKRSGWVVIIDSDHYSVSIDSPVPQIERKFVQFRAENFEHGAIGRELIRYLKEAHLVDISVELSPLVCRDYIAARRLMLIDHATEQQAVRTGFLSEKELRLFLRGLEEWHQRGIFYFAGCLVLARGRRPS